MLKLFAPKRAWRVHLCATTPDQRPYLDALTRWLRANGHSILAAPDAPMDQRIAAARSCEVSVLLLGPEFGAREPGASFSGAELETYAALEGGASKLLVFALSGVETAPEPEQREFIARVRDFSAGTFQATVTSPALLLEELAAALARLDEAARATDNLDRAVMISSTGDLVEERIRLRALLTHLRHPVIDYQTAASETGTPIERVTGWAEQCRALLLILGKRYGFVSPVDGLGVTELEFVTALRAGRPILALLRPDALTTEDPDQRQFVERVRHFLPPQRVKVCETLDDLEREARDGLSLLLAAPIPQGGFMPPPIPEERARAWSTRQVQRWLGTLPHARNPQGMPLVDLPLLLVPTPMDLQAVLNETHNNMYHFISESMTYIESVTPEDALAQTPRMIIAGPPGAGKSVILRWLALRAGARVPALVALPAYAAARRAGRAASFLDYLEIEERRMLLTTPGDPSRWRAALEGGMGLLLLDDWSALEPADQEIIAADIANCADSLPRATPIAVTQRVTLPAAASPLDGFTPMYVLPLMQRLQNEIIRQWLEAARPVDGRDEQQSHDLFDEITFQMRTLDDTSRWARTPLMLVTLITVLDSLQERSLGILGGSGVGLLRRALRLILTLERRPRALWEKERLLMSLARRTMDAEAHLTHPNNNPKSDKHETFPDELLRAAWADAAPAGGELDETLRGLAPLVERGADGWAYAHSIFGAVYRVAALAERPEASRLDWVMRRRLYESRNMTPILLPGELDRQFDSVAGDAVVEILMAGDTTPVDGSGYTDPNHYALLLAAAAQGARAAAQARGGPGPEIARRLCALAESGGESAIEQVTWSLLSLGPAAEAALDTLIAALERPHSVYAESALEGLARVGVARAREVIEAYHARYPYSATWYAPIATQVADLRERSLTGEVKKRNTALYNLSSFGPFAAPAVPDVIPLLTSEDDDLRANAAQALSAIGAPSAPALPTLFKMALDDAGQGGIGFNNNAFIAAWAVKRLASLVTADMISEAQQRLASDDVKAVDRAIWVLEALGPVAAGAAPRVIELALHGPQGVSSFIVAKALHAFGPEAMDLMTRALANAIQSGDQKSEERAFNFVNALKADAAPLCGLLRDRIREIVNDPDAPSAYRFFSALGELGAAAAPALPDLRVILDGPRQARAAGQVGEIPAWKRTQRASQLAQSALDTISEMGSAARPLLNDVLALVDDEDNSTRNKALYALSGMKVEVTPEIEAILLRGMADSNKNIRHTASKAAEELRPLTGTVAAALLGLYHTEPTEYDRPNPRHFLNALWDAGSIAENPEQDNRWLEVVQAQPATDMQGGAMPQPTLLLGVDVSTTGVKALLVDEHGGVVASASVPHASSSPHPLWSEQRPADWWDGALTAIRSALAQSGAAGSSVRAVGLTGQMHGMVALDGAGVALRPAILWNDQRTAAECDEIRARVGRERLIATTGNDALTGFTAPKILWVRRHEPDIYARIRHILLPKDYLRLLLTGDYAMDKADGSGTLLFDLAHRDWSGDVLAALELNPAWFPPTYEGPVVTGKVSVTAAALTGLAAGTPVVAGGGDQAAQAVGVGAVTPGVLALTLGTSGVIFGATDHPVIEPQGRLQAFCHAVPDRWHMMGVMLSAAGSLQWLRDTLTPYAPFEQLMSEAAKVPAGSDGLLFLPYLTGERTPYPDPLARGAWIGLTTRHTRAHLIRSTLEGVAFGMRDMLGLMRDAGLPVPDRARLSGGGARGELWRSIIASVLRFSLDLPASTEGAAHGAALLAGVGVGVWPDVDAAVATIGVTPGAEPDAADAARYDALYERYHALYPTLAPTFHDLARFDGANE